MKTNKAIAPEVIEIIRNLENNVWERFRKGDK